MAQQLDKVYQCLSCKQDIKLARKDDNTGWIRYNLDGSLHEDGRKKGKGTTTKEQQQQQQQEQDQPQVAPPAAAPYDASTATETLTEIVTILARRVTELTKAVETLNRTTKDQQKRAVGAGVDA